MFGYIYKTTIIKEDSSLHMHFYIGQKQSTKIVEGYYGSGKKIQDYLKKHLKRKTVRNIKKNEAEELGLHREILAYADNIDELNELEARYVDPELDNPLCMNVMTGGYGRVVKQEVIDEMSRHKRESNLHFWTNGVKLKMSKDCPGDGYRRGKKLDGYAWYNNGTTQIYSNYKPDGWKEGKLGTTYGKSPWNKGLTKETSLIVKRIAEKEKGRIITEETRKKLSASLKGHCYSPRTTFKKGNIPWSKGLRGKGILKKNKTSFHGEHKGMTWYNNGVKQLRAFEKPVGINWVLGMLPVKRKNKERDSNIVDLYYQGNSILQLSKEFKLSLQAIKRIIKHSEKPTKDS